MYKKSAICSLRIVKYFIIYNGRWIGSNKRNFLHPYDIINREVVFWQNVRMGGIEKMNMDFGLNLTQEQLMNLFKEEGKIGMNSGTSFGVEGTGFVRLNVAVPRTVLEEGMKRIKKAVDSLK